MNRQLTRSAIFREDNTWARVDIEYISSSVQLDSCAHLWRVNSVKIMFVLMFWIYTGIKIRYP